MQNLFELSDHEGAGMQARFYVNGKRVSRDEFETIETRAYMSGRLHTFHTIGKPIAGGKIRRINYKTAQY